MRVAAGDVTGDGRADIITGPGPGRAAEARVFDAATGGLLSNVLAYPELHRRRVRGDGGAGQSHGDRHAGRRRDRARGVRADRLGVRRATRQTPGSMPSMSGRSRWRAAAPTFGGVATLGVPRPDVAAIYGAQYAHAGFQVDVAGLAPGVYDVVLFGHSAVSGTFNVQRLVRVTVTP